MGLEAILNGKKKFSGRNEEVFRMERGSFPDGMRKFSGRNEEVFRAGRTSRRPSGAGTGPSGGKGKGVPGGEGGGAKKKEKKW